MCSSFKFIVMSTTYISKDIYVLRNHLEQWYFDNIHGSTRRVQSIVTTVLENDNFHTVCTWI